MNGPDGGFVSEPAGERYFQTLGLACPEGTEEAASEPVAATAETPPDARAEETGRRQKQSAILVELAQEADLFCSPAGDAWAVIPTDGHRETWPVASRTFRQWLRTLFH